MVLISQKSRGNSKGILVGIVIIGAVAVGVIVSRVVVGRTVTVGVVGLISLFVC